MAEYDDDDSVVSREWEDYAWVDDPATYMEEGDVEDERKKSQRRRRVEWGRTDILSILPSALCIVEWAYSYVERVLKGISNLDSQKQQQTKACC